MGSAVYLISVPLGLLLAFLIARRFAPEAEGDGVPAAMAALVVRGGRLRLRSWVTKIAATAATLGAGGSAGREGPIVQIGATVGSVAGRYTHQGEDKMRSLVAAGAGAGIGASFNAPIAGMLFAMEVILGNFGLRHLNVVVITSVSAAVTSRLLVGEEQLLRAASHSLEDPRELVLYAHPRSGGGGGGVPAPSLALASPKGSRSPARCGSDRSASVSGSAPSASSTQKCSAPVSASSGIC